MAKSDSKVWNDCFNKVEAGLKTHRFESRSGRNILLRELFEESFRTFQIESDDGINSLVDLIAYLVDTNGYKIEEDEKG